jgi:uncharacterized Zn finger protein (UPF0148 family)
MTCDVCGAPNANEDYDGVVLCVYHRALSDLEKAKEEYKEKRKWIINVWLVKLREQKEEIERLKKIIADYEKGGGDGS